jgi:hypothetical protein
MTTKLRKFKLKGGPFSGWEGEFVEQHQDVIFWGPDGGKSFAYKRRPEQPGKPVVFAYDKPLTAMALQVAGVSPDDIEIALADDQHAAVLAQRAREAAPAPFTQKVEVRRSGDIAEMWVDGDLVDLVEWSQVANPDDAKAWVASVMLPDKETSNP